MFVLLYENLHTCSTNITLKGETVYIATIHLRSMYVGDVASKPTGTFLPDIFIKDRRNIFITFVYL